MTHEQIHQLFTEAYNPAKWRQFLGETFANARLLSTPEILLGIDSHVASQVLKLGYIVLNENGIERYIAVYDITLAIGIVLERNRVGLRNLLRKHWKDLDAAFIVYHNHESEKWRFTYVSELTGYDAEGEFIQIKTEPKRYTYVLGKGESCRTAVERFTSITQKANKLSLDDVKEAFSVEKLSKAFFAEYKKHYELFCEFMLKRPDIKSAIFNGEEKAIRDFNKKLLGRIVFLYFIQKKGWLGVSLEGKWGEGDQHFLTNLFCQSKSPKLFYSEILTKLFFDTLNAKRQDDVIELGHNQPCRIPYLNGGLFEEEDKKHRNIIVEPQLFSDLFDFFNQYNFTIYEDDPSDHTVAVDPEMLGHIFENLLEDNKDKGAFYTPKEIVHYMCQESLIEYLITWFSNKGYGVVEDNLSGYDELIPRTLIEKLIKKKLYTPDQELLCQYSIELNKALDGVKICDPAIGSGAFPMGLLQEIFSAKQSLHHFEHGNLLAFAASEIKLNIIQNSIYGVDIEKGAVDIARLRFWLSLVVDDEEPKALPNLDYKIVVGNSLLSKFNDDVVDIDWGKDTTKSGAFGQKHLEESKKTLIAISQKQKQFFDTKSDKKQLATDIRSLKIDLLINQLELMVTTKGITIQPSGNGKKIKAQTELYLQTEGWKKSIQQLKELKNKPTEPLHFFDWKLDFPEVMNPLLREDSLMVNAVNLQIQALNRQIDAINNYLGRSQKEYHLLHLQTLVAQSQAEIIKEQLNKIECDINRVYGKIEPVDSNVNRVGEPDMSLTYGLSSVNASIIEINKQADRINSQMTATHPEVGFDIVIGNPPYVDYRKIDDDTKKHLSKYQSYKDVKTGSLYVYFIELGVGLLRSKAVLSYINPYQYLSADSGLGIRRFVVSRHKFKSVIDISNIRVFENASTYTCINTIIKDTPQNNISIYKPSSLSELHTNSCIIKSEDIFKDTDKYRIILSQNDLIDKIEKQGIKLEEICSIFCGLSTAGFRNFVTRTPSNQHLEYMSFVEARQIQKYGISTDKYIDTNVYNPKLIPIFKNPCLFMARMTSSIRVAISEANQAAGKVNVIHNFKPTINPKYLLALLNSKTLNYYYCIKNESKHLSGGAFGFDIPSVEELPIKIDANQELIIVLVDMILEGKKLDSEANTSELESQIDHLVYRLYELTYDEVKVIDPTFSLSKTEYEAIKLK